MSEKTKEKTKENFKKHGYAFYLGEEELKYHLFDFIMSGEISEELGKKLNIFNETNKINYNGKNLNEDDKVKLLYCIVVYYIAIYNKDLDDVKIKTDFNDQFVKLQEKAFDYYNPNNANNIKTFLKKGDTYGYPYPIMNKIRDYIKRYTKEDKKYINEEVENELICQHLKYEIRCDYLANKLADTESKDTQMLENLYKLTF